MQNFEIIARAVIVDDNKLLLCKRKDRDYYFLPGGHVEFGEKAEDALKREIKEELGVEAGDVKFIGAMENFFTEDGTPHHEFNIFFTASLSANKIESCEEHICFHWADAANLARENIVPEKLKDSIKKWLQDGQVFWSSQFNEQ